MISFLNVSNFLYIPGNVVNQRQSTEVLAVVQGFHQAFGIRFHAHRTLHDHVPSSAFVPLPEHCKPTKSMDLKDIFHFERPFKTYHGLKTKKKTAIHCWKNVKKKLYVDYGELSRRPRDFRRMPIATRSPMMQRTVFVFTVY